MNDIYAFSLGEGSRVYESFRYPGGEWQVRLRQAEIADIKAACDVRVTARLTSAEEIVKLLLLVDAIQRTRGKEGLLTIVLPYLPYGRADRAFVPGDCGGLETFGRMLNILGNVRIATLDAHSHVAGAALPGLIDCSPKEIVQAAIGRFASHVFGGGWMGQVGITVVFPDEGALDRYGFSVPDSIEGNRNLIALTKVACKKRRDPATGRILGIDLAGHDLSDEPVIVIDDICDGGATFEAIGVMIATDRQPRGLYVTHGIFSKGTANLRKYFQRIYCSDSWPNTGRTDVVVDAEFPSHPTIIRALAREIATEVGR